MKVLLSRGSRKRLFDFLIQRHSSANLKELSKKLNIPKGTLDNWRYDQDRYIPEDFIPKQTLFDLEILDKQDNNWGQVIGGRKTYKILIDKYGIEEIKKRQLNGGKQSKRKEYTEPFKINIRDKLFLEFYGIIMGDGWISRLKYKNKVIHLIGLSGHSKLDRDFFSYCKNNIKILFNRKAYLKEKPKNSIELNFSHKMFFIAFTNELNFPIGKKIDLKIDVKVYNLGYEYLKHLIRGIFDTDGSFYLDKTPVGLPYPCISIQMKSPKLIKQINDILINQGFRVVFRENKNMITLKGSIQLSKWMEEIGSSNKKHLEKINKFLKSKSPSSSTG